MWCKKGKGLQSSSPLHYLAAPRARSLSLSLSLSHTLSYYFFSLDRECARAKRIVGFLLSYFRPVFFLFSDCVCVCHLFGIFVLLNHTQTQCVCERSANTVRAMAVCRRCYATSYPHHRPSTALTAQFILLPPPTPLPLITTFLALVLPIHIKKSKERERDMCGWFRFWCVWVCVCASPPILLRSVHFLALLLPFFSSSL